MVICSLFVDVAVRASCFVLFLARGCIIISSRRRSSRTLLVVIYTPVYRVYTDSSIFYFILFCVFDCTTIRDFPFFLFSFLSFSGPQPVELFKITLNDDPALRRRLLDNVVRIWRGREVPQGWKDGIITILHK